MECLSVSRDDVWRVGDERWAARVMGAVPERRLKRKPSHRARIA
jgi:hypothetical protein